MQESNYRMIDVSRKPETYRIAVATGEIIVGRDAFQTIIEGGLPKGDVLKLAEIAGILGVKNTSAMIPLCHPLSIDHTQVVIEKNNSQDGFIVYCFVTATARTGVEMEALAGVNAALLTIYDLTKMIEPHLIIQGIHLLVKIGGKSGLWLSPKGVPPAVLDAVKQPSANLKDITFGILTVSDRASEGIYEDLSGALMKEVLEEANGKIAFYEVVSDDKDKIAASIKSACEKHPLDVVITTGGTGVAGRDVTPEALLSLSARDVPGIGELLRAHGAQYTKNTWSSRSLAVVYNNTLLISLPGSPKAVKEGLEALMPLLPHFALTLRGEKHD
jgi:cyclic pyranopterin phosphate synthase